MDANKREFQQRLRSVCTEAVVELAISPEGATSLPVASATGLARFAMIPVADATGRDLSPSGLADLQG